MTFSGNIFFLIRRPRNTERVVISFSMLMRLHARFRTRRVVYVFVAVVVSIFTISMVISLMFIRGVSRRATGHLTEAPIQSFRNRCAAALLSTLRNRGNNDQRRWYGKCFIIINEAWLGNYENACCLMTNVKPGINKAMVCEWWNKPPSENLILGWFPGSPPN